MKSAAESGRDSAFIGRLVTVPLPIMVRTVMLRVCDCHEDNHCLLGVVPGNCYNYYIDYTSEIRHKSCIKNRYAYTEMNEKMKIIKNVKVTSAYALQVITMIFLNLYIMLF
jgi:hypothetical protein